MEIFLKTVIMSKLPLMSLTLNLYTFIIMSFLSNTYSNVIWDKDIFFKTKLNKKQFHF